METPTGDEPLIEKYPLLLNNIPYNLIIEIQNENIIFTCSEEENIENKKTFYTYQCNLETLQNKSKAFLLYQEIPEIFLLFQQLYENKLLWLQSNNSETINLVIKLYVLVKEEIIYFPLKSNNNNKKSSNKNLIDLKIKMDEMEKDFDNKSDELNKEINEIKNSNASIRNELDNLLKMLKSFKKLLKDNENKNGNIDEKIQNLICMKNLVDRINILESKQNNNTQSIIDISFYNSNNNLNDQKLINEIFNNFKSSSNIIKQKTEIDFIIKRLVNFQPSSFSLLYQGTKDSDDIRIFHEKCDKFKNVIVIILTNKGRKFGGFTSKGFDSSGLAKKDNEAFLFSIDRKKIYNFKQGQNAIFCNKNCGPIFCAKSQGIYNIYIPNQFFKSKSLTSKNGFCFEFTEPFELNFGEKEFDVVELEVYKVN